jgi:hypothetical protein
VRAPGQIVSAMGGLLADYYRLATCQLQNPHSYLKFLAINHARRTTGSTTFIETGTYLGGTAHRCSKVFDAVYTIELSPELAQQAKRNLARRANVEVIQGDAIVELDNLLQSRPIERATIFLDGHFSGGNTSCGTVAEPAIQELEILARHRHRINAIIIDDFRNFGTEPGHPPKSQILHALETFFPETDFTIRIQNDQVLVTRKSTPCTS